MHIPNRRTLIAAGCVAAAATALAVPASGDDGAPLVSSGIAGSLPSDPAIGSVAAGGRPWVAGPSSIRVTRDGSLVARVRGLVIPDATFNNTNPIPLLAASLVCGNAVVATTSPVPFSTAGNALIKAEVAVPARCLAPVVLLGPAGPTGALAAYVGATGND